MNSTRLFSILAIFGLAAYWSGPIQAQNINVETPFTSVSDSSYENTGVDFGFAIPAGRGSGSRVVGLGPQGQQLPFVMYQIGAGPAIPQFGGYSPGASFGIGNGNFSLGFDLSKGSTRTNTTVAPSLTTQNGFGGSLISGQSRPFVTGFIPVVGGGFSNAAPGFGGYGPEYGQYSYQPDNGVTRAIASGQLDLSRPSTPEPRTNYTGPVTFSNEHSTAMQGDLSVSAIKARREQRLESERTQLVNAIKEAKEFESQKNYAAARAKYQEASKLTDDQKIKEQLKRLIKATRNK